MGWIPQSPEPWVALALLVLIVAAITRATFSPKPDARMDFLVGLIENIPTDEVPADRIQETNPVRTQQET